jgi:phage terminase small subunit
MARRGVISDQQKAFADEYIINGQNVYQAAIKAGYSDNYARVGAYKLIDNARVKAYIDDRMKPILAARTIKVEEAVAMISDIAQGKKGKDGKTPSDNTRLKALDMLMRANGQYTDKVEVSGDVDVASILKKAKSRADKAKKSTK